MWSAVAGDWQASANTVALVTGVIGGLVSAAGCVIGGWLCDRMNRKAAYALDGVLQALCAVAMAVAPHTETTYIVFTLIYAFITGLTFAGFSAFVLEAMGLGAAATKYSLFASLSNMPIAYMTSVDGWAYERRALPACSLPKPPWVWSVWSSFSAWLACCKYGNARLRGCPESWGNDT